MTLGLQRPGMSELDQQRYQPATDHFTQPDRWPPRRQLDSQPASPVLVVTALYLGNSTPPPVRRGPRERTLIQ